MIDKKKVLAIAVFIFFGFFMFAFANPSDGIRRNLEEDTANDQNITPVVDNNATVNNDQLLNIPAVDNVVNVITEENAPTITLGENVNSMEVNGKIPEFNATVDAGTLEITNNINPNVIGTYEVTFTATSDGGQTTVIIEFYVVDTTKPVIELNGEDVIIVRMGHDYVEPGYKALDNYDGNITDKVLVNNSDFDTNIKGEHLITYNVSDNQGNKADEVVRKVIVTDTTELVNIIESGYEIIEETTNKDVSDKLEELLDELKEEIENGNKIVEDLESEQKTIDDKTEEIEEIINQIKNMTFNVKFVDYDDSIIYETTAKYMETVDAPKNPTRKGYTFKTWDKLAKNIVNDIVIKAIYEINNYTIEYELNGGEINKILPEKYTVETDDINLDRPTKEGYTFIGWFNKDTKVEKIEKGSTGNLVLTAKYEANKDTKYTVEVYEETLKENEYTKVDTLTLKGETDKEVTYELASRTGFTGTTQNVKGTVRSDGSLVLKAYYKRNSYKLTVDTKEETKKYGETISLENPSKKGYTFIGWSEKVPSTMPARNLTINSKWEAIKYTIEYKLNGGSIENEVTEYTIETPTFELVRPTKEGYTFIGWFNKDIRVEKIEKGSTGNLVLTAKYETNKDTKYTVEVYEENLVKDTYTKVDSLILKGETDKEVTYELASRTGFTAETENVKGTVASDGSLVLKAYYKRNSYKLTVDTKEETKKYGETISLENPSKKGYTFIGWSEKVPSTMPAKNLTINSKWETIKYTIEYKLNGGTVEDEVTEYTIETPTFELVSPTKEGYTFIGWFNKDIRVEKIEKGSTGNLVLTAKYEANKDTKYTVEVYEETLTQDEYTKVDTLTLKGETDKEVTYELASRTGFTAETENVKGTVASDGSLVLKAYYKRNSYKLTVDTKEETKKYGETISLENPSKKGYTFIGWSEKVPSTMPAKNLTVMSMWKANKYQVTFYDEDKKTVLFTKTYEYDQTVDLANVKTPTKESTNTKVFEFTGWSNGSKIVESIKIKGDNSLYATYSSSTRYYEVVFKDYDGTVLSKQDNIEYNKDAIAPKEPTRENYIFTGWDKDYHNVTKNLIITAQYKAKQIGIKVVEKPNIQFEFQKNTKADLSKLIIVYDVYADGSEKETKEYTTDIDTSAVVSNKTLTISHNGFDDTSIKYSVINEEAFQSKFEVIFKSGSYRETKSSYCKKNCDNEKNTRKVILNQDFLEIIEHYNELIKVTKVLARFNNGTSEALELSDMVRYSYISSRGWFNTTYFSPVRIATSRVTKVFSEATAINKVEITYNREGYGNYVVVFKNNNGIYVPIDEYKLK